MELKKKLENIFNQFKTNGQLESFLTFNSGHINDTFLIKTNSSPNYVLQKINGHVFKNAIDVIENKVNITKHLAKKGIKTLQFIPNKNNKFYLKDTQINYWCLSEYIEKSQTFIKTESTKIAYEAGLATGLFLAQTQDFKGKLVETLPKFHSMSFRFFQFEKALGTAQKNRIAKAQNWIDFVLSQKQEMMVLDNAISNKKIPLRVTHNDTKISNILFDDNNKAICLIDLDTVMKGCIHFDYGDSLRTICSTAKEDETDLNEVNFNFEYFQNYTLGFLKNVKQTISKEEITYLPQSPKIMTFIMGLRFLTDYLNNDIYYKISYTEHSLNRAINQFTLVKKLQKRQAEINDFIVKIME